MSILKREIRPQTAALIVVTVVVGVFALYIWKMVTYQPIHSAATSGCLSNLKQLALGFSMYASDYDETAMPVEDWHDNLLPYIKNLDRFRCPTAVRNSGKDSFGYAYNSALSNERLPAKEKREGTILFFDSSALSPDATGGADIVAKPARHGKKNGFAYLDGRARTVKDGTDPGSWTLSPTR